MAATLAAFLLVASVLVASALADADLTGHWALDAGYTEDYSVTASAVPSSFNVAVYSSDMLCLGECQALYLS